MLLEQSSPIKPREELWISVFFVLFVITLLVIHVTTFFALNITVIDSDQPYMWIGARDFARGDFYEPRYYAQDYNTFMEALFAVPFIWMKFPVYYAVPIATHIIFLFPFLFTSFYLFFHNRKIQAILVLSILLCLPAEYHLLTSLPRGFVTGLFFTSFFVVSIVNPHNLRFLTLNTLLAVLGYFVNPNSVIVSAPFLFYIFSQNYKIPRYYVITFLCLCAFYPLHLFFNGFYNAHPGYVINGIHYRFSTVFFWNNITDLDKRFAHISFFVANNCLALLTVLFFLSIALYRSNKKAFASFWVFIAMVLFSFCSGKTSEGSTWAYMSFGRMYLGVPVFIGLFLAVIKFKPHRLYFIFFCVPLIFSTYKLVNLDKLLVTQYDSRRFQGVKLFTLKSTLEVINFYKNVCEKKHTDFLLISTRFWLNNLVCYGGPAIYPDYPQTQETRFEKRYWVRTKNNALVFKSFILISSVPNLDALLPATTCFKLEKMDDYGLIYVKENMLRTKHFITLVNMHEPYD